MEHVYQLAFCLDLEEFGIDPVVISSLIKQFWESVIFTAFSGAELTLKLVSDPKPTRSDMSFAVFPEFMSGGWYQREGALSSSLPGVIDLCPFRTIADAQVISANRRSFILNLSVIIRLIRQAIIDLGMSDHLLNHLKPGDLEAKAWKRATRTKAP